MAPLIEEKILGIIEFRRKDQDLRNRSEDAIRISSGGRSRPRSKGIVGGFVRSFKFTYERDASIAHGSFSVEFDVDNHQDIDATMVIIDPAEADNGERCERIVKETEKLAGHHESVVEAYFSSYCPTIQKYVVVYERFDGYFNENTERFDNNPFFANENRSELTDFWRNKVRSLIDVLCTARVRHVIHGGFSNETSYVLSAGTLKIINIARYDGTSHVRDLKDLNNYIRGAGFFMASTSPEWEGLTYLLDSSRMQENDWSIPVLRHPILVDADGKLESFEEVEVFMWAELTIATRNKFANALYLKMPHMYLTTPKDGTQPIPARIRDFLDLNKKLHQKLLRKANFSGILYTDIIQIIRNIINHVDHNTKANWTAQQIVDEISRLFPGFMGMAYSIIKVTADDLRELFNGAILPLPY